MEYKFLLSEWKLLKYACMGPFHFLLVYTAPFYRNYWNASWLRENYFTLGTGNVLGPSLFNSKLPWIQRKAVCFSPCLEDFILGWGALSGVCLRISSSLVDKGPTGELWRKSQAPDLTEEQWLNISNAWKCSLLAERGNWFSSESVTWLKHPVQKGSQLATAERRASLLPRAGD